MFLHHKNLIKVPSKYLNPQRLKTLTWLTQQQKKASGFLFGLLNVLLLLRSATCENAESTDTSEFNKAESTVLKQWPDQEELCSVQWYKMMDGKN